MKIFNSVKSNSLFWTEINTPFKNCLDPNLVVIVYRNNTFIGIRFISIDGYGTKELLLK